MSKRQRQYQWYTVDTTTQAEKDLAAGKIPKQDVERQYQRYTVDTASLDKKDLAKIPKRDAERIDARIKGLATDPRPHGCRKLLGTDLHRITQGDYRVIYHISDDPPLVTITDVGHRGAHIYRGLR